MILNKENEVLLGLRKGSHGEGEWSFPGGHVEFGETLINTAIREVKEETGLDIEEFSLISVCDEMRYIESDDKHYVNIGILGKYQGGEPKNMEPEKLEEWRWFKLDNLPKNIFEATGKTLQNYLSKRIYKHG